MSFLNRIAMEIIKKSSIGDSRFEFYVALFNKEIHKLLKIPHLEWSVLLKKYVQHKVWNYFQDKVFKKETSPFFIKPGRYWKPCSLIVW